VAICNVDVYYHTHELSVYFEAIIADRVTVTVAGDAGLFSRAAAVLHASRRRSNTCQRHTTVLRGTTLVCLFIFLPSIKHVRESHMLTKFAEDNVVTFLREVATKALAR